MFDTVADDWEIRFVNASAFLSPVWSQETLFEIRSKSADWSSGLSFSGLTLRLGFKVGRTRSAQKAAEIADTVSSDMTKTNQLFWKLQCRQPFCLNDIDWAHGIVAFYNIGIGEHLLLNVDKDDTLLRFGARSREKGELFVQPGLGLPFDSGALIPTITTTAGLWKLEPDMNANGDR